VLSVCDADAGLVVTDCADLAMTPTCGDAGGGQFACVPGEGGGGDETGFTPTTSADDSGGEGDNGDGGQDDAGNGTISCACRSDTSGWSGLLAGLGVLALRRRRRA
jgi:MYXO-CTERM domain-containing protein